VARERCEERIYQLSCDLREVWTRDGVEFEDADNE